MYSEHEKWDRLKTEYLRQVEKVLSSVRSPRVRQVVDDLRWHLDQRFAELEPARRTADNLEAIIADMGPASDYAELLAPNNTRPDRKTWREYAVAGILAAVVVIAAAALLSKVIFSSPQPVTSERFLRGLSEKVDKFKIDAATLNDVIKTFGQPVKYVWGAQVLDRKDLPRRYVVIYPSGFRVFMADNKVVELRHEGPETGYVWHDKLRVGSSLEQAIETLGEPSRTVTGAKNLCVDGVLYEDIEGRKGYCYYSRADQDVRLWFADYKIAAIYMTRNDYNPGIVPQQKGRLETNTIIPKVGIGRYTLGMSKDDVLKHLGKPKVIFHRDEKYTLDNLPKEYFMVYDHISFGVVDDSVEGISALSPLYKFTNGLGVGDSEQKIKQAFGNNFVLKETAGKDFLTYEDEGIQFEIHKDNRTIMEISVTHSNYNGG
ncbi:MAG: hypothetical protein ACYTBJ_18040 [Planctomycetota bacterium]|jgi:hypothetical protein